jgi:hypothetical protein
MSSFDLTGYRMMDGMHKSSPIELYWGSLWEYSVREVSFEHDRIIAFSAIIDAVQDMLSSGSYKARGAVVARSAPSSLAGLPTLMINSALLWEQAKPKLRRQNASWPSWS